MEELLKLERELDNLGGELDALRDKLYDIIAEQRVKALDGQQPESVEDRVRYRLKHHMHPDINDLLELWKHWTGEAL